MTRNFSEEAATRDETLVQAMCHSIHRSSRIELREWIQAELVALINASELLLLEINDPVAAGIREKIARLQMINRTSLPRASNEYDKVISDVSNGAWANVHDAYTAMQKECSELINIVEELVSMRKVLEPMLPKED